MGYYMKLIVRDGEGTILAQAEHAEEVRLCIEHIWDEGDECKCQAVFYMSW